MIGHRTKESWEGGDHRRSRVLRTHASQVLWALLLTLLILLGVAAVFGREVGYPVSFGVCGGLAALIAVSFLLIHIIDRATSRLS